LSRFYIEFAPPHAAQVIPAMAVSFYTFEEVKKMFPGGSTNGIEK
jgi:hypothetical protein